MRHHDILLFSKVCILWVVVVIFFNYNYTCNVFISLQYIVKLVLKEMTGDGEDVTINGAFPGPCQEKLTHISQELLLLKHSLHPTLTIYIVLTRRR